MKLSRIAIVGAAGAAFAYFLDPKHGPRRRHQVAGRAASMLRRGRRAAMPIAAGSGARATSPSAAADYDDATLSEKVYTYLNADPRYDGRVNVSAQYGEVVLVGEVEDPDDVIRRVRDVPGVGPIKSLLHRPGTPAPHMT